MENQQLSLHYNAPAHRSVFVKDFLAKNNWKHWSIPHTHLTWLQLIFTSYQDCISIEGTALLWFYWSHSECDGRAEKAFTKWVPGMFPTTLKSLAEVYICTRGLFWRKGSLNDCTVLYFSEIKWFREHCVATAYTYETVPHFKLDWSVREHGTDKNVWAYEGENSRELEKCT
jgi:hypothetical protein